MIKDTCRSCRDSGKEDYLTTRFKGSYGPSANTIMIPKMVYGKRNCSGAGYGMRMDPFP